MVDGGMLSGGIVFAIAAALWLVYLIPTWVRRHEYMAAERNSVRLQQTLRVLAETSEMPEEVRLEVSSREVAEQQKTLRRIEAEQEAARKARSRAAIEKARAEARAASARAEAEAEDARRTAAAETARARAKTRLLRSRRRARLATSLFLLMSIGTAAVSAVMAFSTGAWVLPVAATGATVVAVGLLNRMARIGARVPMSGTVADRHKNTRVASPLFDAAEYDQTPVEKTRETWTPVPLPKQLASSRGSQAEATVSVSDAHRRLREAALASAMAQRAQEIAADEPAASLDRKRTETTKRQNLQGASAGETPEPDATRQGRIENTGSQTVSSESGGERESPYAQMGRVDAREIGVEDLVSRRRAVG